MSQWKDISSYSRSEPHPRTPKSWELRAGGLRIVVTRKIWGGSNEWYLECEPFFAGRTLKNADIDEAKKEALGLVDLELNKVLSEMWG